MAISVADSGFADNVAGETSATFSLTLSANDLVAVFVVSGQGNAGKIAASDDLNGAYASAGNNTTGTALADIVVAGFYKTVTVGGSATLTVSLSGGGSNLTVYYVQFTGAGKPIGAIGPITNVQSQGATNAASLMTLDGGPLRGNANSGYAMAAGWVNAPMSPVVTGTGWAEVAATSTGWGSVGESAVGLTGNAIESKVALTADPATSTRWIVLGLAVSGDPLPPDPAGSPPPPTVDHCQCGLTKPPHYTGPWPPGQGPFRRPLSDPRLVGPDNYLVGPNQLTAPQVAPAVPGAPWNRPWSPNPFATINITPFDPFGGGTVLPSPDLLPPGAGVVITVPLSRPFGPIGLTVPYDPSLPIPTDVSLYGAPDSPLPGGVPGPEAPDVIPPPRYGIPPPDSPFWQIDPDTLSPPLRGLYYYDLNNIRSLQECGSASSPPPPVNPGATGIPLGGPTRLTGPGATPVPAPGSTPINVLPIAPTGPNGTSIHPPVDFGIGGGSAGPFIEGRAPVLPAGPMTGLSGRPRPMLAGPGGGLYGALPPSVQGGILPAGPIARSSNGGCVVQGGGRDGLAGLRGVGGGGGFSAPRSGSGGWGTGRTGRANNGTGYA